jgi:hypothetical protein
MTRTLHGLEAIRYAERFHVPLNKYADPIDPTARRVSVAEALEIVIDFPRHIYVSIRGAR